jgi:CRISPR/Cas system endoribonuclease Cas6 (RAMP superfamily)
VRIVFPTREDQRTHSNTDHLLFSSIRAKHIIIKIIHLNFRISIYSKEQLLYFIYQYGFPISLN